uniref:Uncharacterized protein n=1 Tax=Aegilops tauschii subsp. strangulata TaxID=200361 RepID=A0A453M5Y6_AEGTS
RPRRKFPQEEEIPGCCHSDDAPRRRRRLAAALLLLLVAGAAAGPPGAEPTCPRGAGPPFLDALGSRCPRAARITPSPPLEVARRLPALLPYPPPVRDPIRPRSSCPASWPRPRDSFRAPYPPHSRDVLVTMRLSSVLNR